MHNTFANDSSTDDINFVSDTLVLILSYEPRNSKEPLHGLQCVTNAEADVPDTKDIDGSVSIIYRPDTLAHKRLDQYLKDKNQNPLIQ